MKSIDTFHPLTLNVGMAVHNANWNWKNVSSPFIRIYYVTEGTAKIIFLSETYQLRPGYMYMIPAYVFHSYQCTGHFVHYYIHIYENIEFGSNFLEDWEFPVEINAEEFDLKLIKRLAELNPFMKLPKSDPTAYDNDQTLAQSITKNKERNIALKLESRGILLQLLSRFFCAAKEKSCSIDNRIKESLQWIQQNLDKPILVEQLATEACLCKDHYIRLFKKEMGISPLQYITQKKIEKAQWMLVTQNMPTKNIAYSLGYDDYSYFIRIFKKVAGKTPQEYRVELL